MEHQPARRGRFSISYSSSPASHLTTSIPCPQEWFGGRISTCCPFWLNAVSGSIEWSCNSCRRDFAKVASLVVRKVLKLATRSRGELLKADRGSMDGGHDPVDGTGAGFGADFAPYFPSVLFRIKTIIEKDREEVRISSSYSSTELAEKKRSVFAGRFQSQVFSCCSVLTEFAP